MVRGSFMATLEGPIICQPALYATHTKISAQLVKIPLRRVRNHRDGFLGYKGLYAGTIGGLLSRRHFQWKGGPLLCSLRSSSDGNGSMPENFSENDAEFVNASVIEAVEVKSGSDGFFIRMRSGRNLRCVHNSPQGGHLPDYAPHPAIVLKMEDGSDILLPIIVCMFSCKIGFFFFYLFFLFCSSYKVYKFIYMLYSVEMPSVLLMAALRNVPIARPTIYQVVQDMIDKMGYEVHLVRVTRRVHEAYFAQLYLSKVGDKKDIISFDLRPSDAINMAVRCKVPIQVNRTLAYNDGMRIIGQVKHAAKSSQSDGFLTTELDRPDGQPCTETKEFDFVRNMLIAAVEERYTDAAQWRDKLFKLRSKKGTEHD